MMGPGFGQAVGAMLVRWIIIAVVVAAAIGIGGGFALGRLL